MAFSTFTMLCYHYITLAVSRGRQNSFTCHSSCHCSLPTLFFPPYFPSCPLSLYPSALWSNGVSVSDWHICLGRVGVLAHWEDARPKQWHWWSVGPGWRSHFLPLLKASKKHSGNCALLPCLLVAPGAADNMKGIMTNSGLEGLRSLLLPPFPFLGSLPS